MEGEGGISRSRIRQPQLQLQQLPSFSLQSTVQAWNLEPNDATATAIYGVTHPHTAVAAARGQMPPAWLDVELHPLVRLGRLALQAVHFARVALPQVPQDEVRVLTRPREQEVAVRSEPDLGRRQQKGIWTTACLGSRLRGKWFLPLTD